VVGLQNNRVKAIGLGIAAIAALGLHSGTAEAGSQCGGASWYKMGSRTASGERMDAGDLAAAHRTLPFGTRVKVENLGNGRAVVVRINDRGPFVRGRVIDVTRGAAERLGMIHSGVARVKVTVVDGGARLSGSCD
jgi:rare lipoprotein A